MSSEEGGSPAYIIGVVFATLSMFIIWIGYKFLVPMWNMTISPLAAQYPAMVHDDPTYVTAFGTLLFQENILFQYSFFVMGLGVAVVFLVIFAYRRQSTSTGLEDSF